MGREKRLHVFNGTAADLKIFFFPFFQSTLYILSISSLYQQPSVDTLRLMALVCHLESLNSCAAVLVKSYVLQVCFFLRGWGDEFALHP